MDYRAGTENLGLTAKHKLGISDKKEKTCFMFKPIKH